MQKIKNFIISHKIASIIIAVIAVLGITIGLIIPNINNSSSSHSDDEEHNTSSTKSNIKDELSIEINSSLPDIEDYFTKLDNADDYTITYYKNEEEVTPDTKITGEYEVVIEGKKNYRTILKIVDTTPPTVTFDTYTITSGSGYMAENFVKEYEDNSGSNIYVASFASSKDSGITEVGSHEVTIKVCDINNVCTEGKATLVVNEKTNSNNSSNSNKSNNSSNSSSKKTTRKSTETVTLKKENVNYGVVKKTTAVITYEIKSDGSKVELSRKNTKTFYDYSGFNGTVSSMKPEATKLYDSQASDRQTILDATNGYRKEANVSNLKLDKDLSILATVRAMEMAYGNKFSHTRPNGEDWNTFWKEKGFNFTVPSGGKYGENLAYGYTTASAASTGWYNSTTHRENMLNSSFTKIGIGKYTFNGHTYWVQFFSS